MTDDIKPITIILTIHPPKKTSRRVDVAAAPEGEMPLLLTGAFADRHKLADQAFAALLKRKPQTVKASSNGTGKKKTTKHKPSSPAKPDTDTDTDAEPETGPTGPIPEVELDADLPVIEGDDSPGVAADQAQLSMLETTHG